jgi:hypothetical protein
MRYFEYFIGKVQLIKTKRGAADGFKIFSGSFDFILIFHILKQLMQKALQ